MSHPDIQVGSTSVFLGLFVNSLALQTGPVQDFVIPHRMEIFLKNPRVITAFRSLYAEMALVRYSLHGL